MMMNEFVFMEDWDLQAVVRGCSSSVHDQAFPDIMMNVDGGAEDPSPSLFPPWSFDDDQDGLSSFPSVLEITSDFSGLEQEVFDKPLCSPVSHQQALSPHQSLVRSTSSMSVPAEVKKEPQEKQEKKRPVSDSSTAGSGGTSGSDHTAELVAKYKRRKNQQKRVVQQVAADGLLSDMWAWRKYGQKPIKGSPYPRSYYRCSSLKGCLARKQVERSSSDPSIFIVTYTAEHSHAYPTRRNSLAGSTRNKSSWAKRASSTATAEASMPQSKEECSPDMNAILSPTMESVKDEFEQEVSNKNDAEAEKVLEGSEGNNQVVMQDIIFSDDLFPSLEDLEGLLFDQLAETVSKPFVNFQECNQ